jgi:hypothetical protein
MLAAPFCVSALLDPLLLLPMHEPHADLHPGSVTTAPASKLAMPTVARILPIFCFFKRTSPYC